MFLLLSYLSARMRAGRQPAPVPLGPPTSCDDRGRTPAVCAELGQSSVEYAFVILVAAIVGSLAIAWATKTGAIGDLFDSMMNLVKGKAK